MAATGWIPAGDGTGRGADGQGVKPGTVMLRDHPPFGGRTRRTRRAWRDSPARPSTCNQNPESTGRRPILWCLGCGRKATPAYTPDAGRAAEAGAGDRLHRTMRLVLPVAIAELLPNPGPGICRSSRRLSDSSLPSAFRYCAMARERDDPRVRRACRRLVSGR